jgi:very-short-patch-repair endonuclease
LGDKDLRRFEWKYDLYVERKFSDGKNGILIEVDGHSHTPPANSKRPTFQEKQDRRKNELAEILGFGPVLRIRNEDVGFHETVLKRVESALQRREKHLNCMA